MSGPDHRQAYDLLARGDVDGALRFTSELTALPQPTAGAYAARAAALKAAGRPLDALEVNREAARRYPASGATWHNLAATLGDLGRGAGSDRDRWRATAPAGPSQWRLL